MKKVTKDDLLSLIDKGFYELVNSDLKLVSIHIGAIIKSDKAYKFEYICRNIYYIETIKQKYSDVVYNLTDYIWGIYGGKIVDLPKFNLKRIFEFGNHDIYFN